MFYKCTDMLNTNAKSMHTCRLGYYTRFRIDALRMYIHTPNEIYKYIHMDVCTCVIQTMSPLRDRNAEPAAHYDSYLVNAFRFFHHNGTHMACAIETRRQECEYANYARCTTAITDTHTHKYTRVQCNHKHNPHILLSRRSMRRSIFEIDARRRA